MLDITKNPNPINDFNLTMLDTMPIGVSCWRQDMRCFFCNEALVKMLKLGSKQEFLERCAELLPEYQPNGQNSAALMLLMAKNAFKTGVFKAEWTYVTFDGEEILTELTMARVQYQGEPALFLYTQDIRMIKNTVADMYEANERVQSLFEATPLCCTYWGSDMRLIDCNQATLELFGLGCKKDYLDDFFALSPEYQPDGRLSKVAHPLYLRTAFERGYVKFEWMHQKLNGTLLPTEITLVRIRHRDDYIVVGFARDLRELHSYITQIRKTDEATQLMLDAMPMSCTLWDSSLQLLNCNQESVMMFGVHSKQELIAKFHTFSPEYQPDGRLSSAAMDEYFQQAFQTGWLQFDWVYQMEDGTPLPCRVTFSRQIHIGKPIIVAYAQDMREINKAMNDLHEARNAAEENTRAKSEFLANMSHEIRTPMNGVLGLLYLISGTELTEQQKSYVEKANASAKDLLRIINDILDISKIEAGKMQMEHVEFNIRDVFDELEQMFSANAANKGIVLHIHYPSHAPYILLGDPLRLKQVFINLLSNALKFTEKGRIDVYAEILHEIIGCVYIKFCIKDTGVGISREKLAQLFTPFTQADSSITRQYGGTGLGLTISQNIVAMMSGGFHVESEPGVGSTFVFTAWFNKKERLSEGGQHDHGAAAADDAHAQFAGVKVLLVEDNEINRLIAQELLLRVGCVIQIAQNGKEAIEMVKQEDYDIVLMDIQMPVMDGLTATRRIREDGKFANLPIIAMSAHAMAGDKEKSIAHGMNDHISKPVEPARLYDVINKWL